MGTVSAAACSSSGHGDPGGPGNGGSTSSSTSGGSHADGDVADAFVAPSDGGLFDVGTPEAPPPRGDGHVVFRLPDNHWHRLTAKAGAAPEDVSNAMDRVSSGTDSFVNTSKDGAWLVETGSRFGCTTGSCLALFTGDASKGEALANGGQPISTGEGRPAVASGGDVVVYPAAGPHPLDLYAIKRTGGVWGTPVLLTGSSTFDYHHDVAIAWDGSRVVFDCGADKYGAPPTSVCEVGTDGSGFHEVIGPSAGPDHGSDHAIHHPDYTPEGDVVFEADWPSEQVWKLGRGASAPVKLSPTVETDDNSPCVLPDGRIVSLWLGRAGNTDNGHEIKAMNADGSGTLMLLIDVDVVDVGTGCGN